MSVEWCQHLHEKIRLSGILKRVVDVNGAWKNSQNHGGADSFCLHFAILAIFPVLVLTKTPVVVVLVLKRLKAVVC